MRVAREITRENNGKVILTTPAVTMKGLHQRKYKGHTVISYMQGLWQSIKNICKRYGIQTHFKGNRTIKNILVKPKDKDPLDRKREAIYWYQCGELTCDEEYIGEASRTFGDRYKEHLQEPSPTYGHSNTSGCSTIPDLTIIGREDH